MSFTIYFPAIRWHPSDTFFSSHVVYNLASNNLLLTSLPCVTASYPSGVITFTLKVDRESGTSGYQKHAGLRYTPLSSTIPTVSLTSSSFMELGFDNIRPSYTTSSVIVVKCIKSGDKTTSTFWTSPKF